MGSHQEMIIYEKVVLIKCPCSFQSLSYIAVKDFFQMQMCSVAFLPFLILFTALKIKIKIFYFFYKVLHVLVSIYFFRILANQPPPSLLAGHSHWPYFRHPMFYFKDCMKLFFSHHLPDCLLLAHKFYLRYPFLREILLIIEV